MPKRVILILQLLDAKNKPQENQDNDFSTMHKKCDYVFHIGSELIDIVQNYTFLGTRISSSGSFTLSLEHLRQKALHAFFGLRRHTDFNKLKPSLACKIFDDSMILPILTYNSEVWGAFAKSDFKSWDISAIEKTHLQFCKRYLEVHNKASNIACRAELSKFPLIIDINKKILNYLNYLREKEENSIVKLLEKSIRLNCVRFTVFIPFRQGLQYVISDVEKWLIIRT